MSPQNCCLVVNSSYLEFTRCCSSEYVFSYILLNCLLVKDFEVRLNDFNFNLRIYTAIVSLLLAEFYPK